MRAPFPGIAFPAGALKVVVGIAAAERQGYPMIHFGALRARLLPINLRGVL